MKLHVLQHVPFENPGTVSDWAADRKVAVQITRLFENDPFPGLDSFDLLVVMGGPMNISDTHLYPWLSAEKNFLRECLSAGKKILGICLGAQLLAEALGARVFAGQQKEIGWFPIQKNAFSHHPLLKLFPENILPAFHWHGDTFELPREAIPLFSSEATKNQAFIWNEQVLALQFHWEVKPENVQLLIKHSGEDLKDNGAFIQSPAEMLADRSLFSEARKNLFRVLDFMTA